MLQQKPSCRFPIGESRRRFLGQAALAVGGVLLGSHGTPGTWARAAPPVDPSEESTPAAPGAPASSTAPAPRTAPATEGCFVDLLRAPDRVTAFTEEGARELKPARGGRWQGGDLELATKLEEGALRLALGAPESSVMRLHLRWHGDLRACRRLLGDQWERAYGDLRWAPLDPERVMPWYFMSFDGRRTHGHGVRTGPSSLCYWRADGDGIDLWIDVRSGGVGVRLGQRRLEVCSIVCRRGDPGESPFEATRAFCRQMCSRPRLSSHRVYGTNDWYYTYGATGSAAEILTDAQFIVSLSPSGTNPPYTVIDDGWQPAVGSNRGPWDRGNARFPSMPELADAIRKAGARPGIWIRPLGAAKDQPESWRLSREPGLLDPTVPEVCTQVATDISRLRQWGYELIKHDYSTFDISGRWGKDMGADFSKDGWAFYRRDRTTAEVILDFYRTVRQAAGDAIIIGCNTASHLSAGIFELNRVGDDNSGKEWERTRTMGVNCLAFRAPQHETFYAADADCVGWTAAEAIPWEKNRQWLDLLARSGTPLFVSLSRDAVGPEQEKALREALAIAAVPQPVGEALDWMDTIVPKRWKLMGKELRYDW